MGGVLGKLLFEGMMKVFIFHPVCNCSHFGKKNTGCFDLVWRAIFGMPTVPCVRDMWLRVACQW